MHVTTTLSPGPMFSSGSRASERAMWKVRVVALLPKTTSSALQLKNAAIVCRQLASASKLLTEFVNGAPTLQLRMISCSCIAARTLECTCEPPAPSHSTTPLSSSRTSAGNSARITAMSKEEEEEEENARAPL